MNQGVSLFQKNEKKKKKMRGKLKGKDEKEMMGRGVPVHGERGEYLLYVGYYFLLLQLFLRRSNIFQIKIK